MGYKSPNIGSNHSYPTYNPITLTYQTLLFCRVPINSIFGFIITNLQKVGFGRLRLGFGKGGGSGALSSLEEFCERSLLQELHRVVMLVSIGL